MLKHSDELLKVAKTAVSIWFGPPPLRTTVDDQLFLDPASNQRCMLFPEVILTVLVVACAASMFACVSTANLCHRNIM